MKRLGQVTAAMGIWALSLTTGCGNFWVYPGTATSGTGTTGTGDYVYVANANTQSVAGYQVGTGSLTAISGSPFSLGFIPTAAVVNPADSILFVSSSAGIYSYSISSTGVLALLSSGLSSGLDDVVSLAVSPDGNWLFAVSGIATANEVQVYEFAINSSTGVLSPLNSNNQSYSEQYTITAPTSTVPASPSQIAVAKVASGEYLFVALGTGGTLIIPFNTSTGVQVTSPAPPQFSPPTGGANSNYWANDALAVNSSTSVLYVVSSDTSSLNGLIAAYTIASNGTQATLSSLATSATAFQPTAVVLNSAGTYIYVANTSNDSISGFSTTVSGSTLPALSLSPYSFGYSPTGLTVDRSGDYLFTVTSDGSPDLTMYSYDSTTLGKLDEASSTDTGNGTEPAGAVAIAATH
jgi:6-phosphogluconolactonase (cycloisomerase 2 family)